VSTHATEQYYNHLKFAHMIRHHEPSLCTLKSNGSDIFHNVIYQLPYLCELSSSMSM